MQMAEFYNGGTSQMANVSGNFGYSTTSERHPTSLTFGAGDSWTLSGQDFNSGPYGACRFRRVLPGSIGLCS